MSILIKGMDMPKHCADNCPLMDNGRCWGVKNQPEPVVIAGHRPSWCPLIEVKTPHGRLIDESKLSAEMYHEAFEIDSELQKWDSGCWIRYKVYENARDHAPTVIESEE